MWTKPKGNHLSATFDCIRKGNSTLPSRLSMSFKWTLRWIPCWWTGVFFFIIFIIFFSSFCCSYIYIYINIYMYIYMYIRFTAFQRDTKSGEGFSVFREGEEKFISSTSEPAKSAGAAANGATSADSWQL